MAARRLVALHLAGVGPAAQRVGADADQPRGGSERQPGIVGIVRRDGRRAVRSRAASAAAQARAPRIAPSSAHRWTSDTIPSRMLRRLIHSFGAWKLPVGFAKPTISVFRPSCASSAATTGTEPPERWKSGALPKPGLQGARRRLDARMVERRDRGRAAVDDLDLDAHGGRRDRLEVLLHRLLDLAVVLVGDEAGADLRGGPGRDDRLGALAGVAAPDAVDVEGRARRQALEQRVARARRPSAPGRRSRPRHSSSSNGSAA